jgi:hypothetical protein
MEITKLTQRWHPQDSPFIIYILFLKNYQLYIFSLSGVSQCQWWNKRLQQNFTFMWPWIVTNFLTIKPTRCTKLSIYFGMKLYIFRTVPLPIIRSYSLYTQQWYMSYSFVDSFEQVQDGTAVPSWTCSQNTDISFCIKHDYNLPMAVKIHIVHGTVHRTCLDTTLYITSCKKNINTGIFSAITPLLLWLQRIVATSVTSVRRFGLWVHVEILVVIRKHSTQNATKVTVEAQERWGIAGKIPILFISKLDIVYCTELA